MQQLPDKWVAVHGGQVVAVGEDMTIVMDQVGRQGLIDAYIEKVGGEFDTIFTMPFYSSLSRGLVAIFDGPHGTTTFQL